eukprot:8910050-Prorocentrum_lima.AAC.1
MSGGGRLPGQEVTVVQQSVAIQSIGSVPDMIERPRSEVERQILYVKERGRTSSGKGWVAGTATAKQQFGSRQTNVGV